MPAGGSKLWGWVLWAAVLCLPAGCATQPFTQPPPSRPAPTAWYLFYLHGYILEGRGPRAQHPAYGQYDLTAVVKAFEKRGFTVITHVRPAQVDPPAYARTMAPEVRALLSAGVPADHIAVVGFSKGGVIAQYLAAELAQPEMKFVILAGCPSRESDFRAGYNLLLERAAARMRGRFLSVYDAADQIAASCQEGLTRAGVSRRSQEVVLHVGSGHGLFYRPAPAWLDPVTRWIKGK